MPIFFVPSLPCVNPANPGRKANWTPITGIILSYTAHNSFCHSQLQRRCGIPPSGRRLHRTLNWNQEEERAASINSASAWKFGSVWHLEHINKQIFWLNKGTRAEFCFWTRCDDRVQSHQDWKRRGGAGTTFKPQINTSPFPPPRSGDVHIRLSDCHQAVKRYEVMFPTLSLDLISSEAHKSYQVFLEIWEKLKTK